MQWTQQVFHLRNSDALDVVAREGAKESRPSTGAYVPTVVAFFQNANRIAI